MATVKDAANNSGKKRGNVNTLKPFKAGEDARKNGSKGGKRSAELKKERKKAAECMDAILKLKATGKNAKNLMTNMGIKDKDQQNIMLLMATLFAKASSTGDPNAIKTVLEIVGDLNIQTEQQAPTININVSPATEMDIEKE